MAYGIQVRSEYYLVRMDAKTIPARDIKLLRSAPQLRSALQEAIKLLASEYPREAAEMQKVINQANGKGDTNAYKAQAMKGHKIFILEPDYMEEIEQPPE